MDITEIRHKKSELEKAILGLIKEFEKETTVLVNGVIIDQAASIGTCSAKHSVNVEVSTVVF